MIETGVSSVKSGISCSYIYKKMVKKMKSFNFSGSTFEGHGIGLRFREYPTINPNLGYNYINGFKSMSAEFVIEKGMVINFETSYSIFARKSFQIEKTVIVTDNGSRSLEFQKRQGPVFI